MVTDDPSVHKAGMVRAVIEQQQAQITMSSIQLASRGDLQQLKVARENGADFKLADYDGRTALHLAASRGFFEVCSFVLQEGANVNRRGERRVEREPFWWHCLPLQQLIHQTRVTFKQPAFPSLVGVWMSFFLHCVF